MFPRELVAQCGQEASGLGGADPGREVLETRAAVQVGPGRHSAIIAESMNGSELRRPVAITGATLIDGTGRSPLVNATVVIDGDRFSRIGPATETPAPERIGSMNGVWPAEGQRRRLSGAGWP